MTDQMATTDAPAQEVPSKNGAVITSINPSTGEVLGHVQRTDRSGIDAVIRNARDAAATWGRTSAASRRVYLRQLRYTLLNRSEELARLIAMEQGKTQAEAFSIEIFPSLALLKWLEGEGLEALAPTRVSASHPLLARKRMYYRFDPLGVVAIISPWNYPFGIPFMQLATALTAGNVVVIKPSPLTPLVAQKIADICREAGVPANVVNVLQVADEDAPTVVRHAEIDKVVFTGSTETGRKVMAAAAEGPTPVLLELGGKDPAIVAADADLRRAVPGVVWFALENCGQTCAAVEVVYVHRNVAEEFIDGVVELVKQLRVGDPCDPNTDIGPLTDEEQLRTVEAHVQDAVDRGASVLTGGTRIDRPGLYYAPTVLTNVDPDMRIVREETFGPVIPIMVVDSVEEAVDLSNRSAAGLTGSLWTSNPTEAHDVAARLRVGAVNVNDHACHWGEPRAAWGGVGESGFGRTLGRFGLMEMVNVKFVTEDYKHAGADPWWYPYDKHLTPLLTNTARALYGPVTRRPWAFLNLLLNPRTYERVNLFEYVRHIRKWF